MTSLSASSCSLFRCREEAMLYCQKPDWLLLRQEADQPLYRGGTPSSYSGSGVTPKLTSGAGGIAAETSKAA
ncbi:hypothetical protein [Zymomonas mobilis]|uniref:hypothetical protein n=1 Tax=Zymomonas mobilis TaxID=542 RepID=UPI0021AB96E8|nr:hypothetical protein [Zymomonas mobilis]